MQEEKSITADKKWKLYKQGSLFIVEQFVHAHLFALFPPLTHLPGVMFQFLHVLHVHLHNAGPSYPQCAIPILCAPSG